MLQRLRELAANRESFSFETTLSGRGYDNTGEHPHLGLSESHGFARLVDPGRLALIEPSASGSFMADPERSVQEPPPMSEGARKSMRAMRRAYADVVLENLALGMPVIQWRKDKGVVEVPAEQLAPLARRILETNGELLPEAEERELLKHLKV